MTANTLGIDQCTVSKTIVEVCKANNAILGPHYLYLPHSENYMRKIAPEFELKFGMPQAFGCIDGTNIHIKRSIENSQDYYNYKQLFSLNVQAVCDSRRRFIDLECKWPGSVHDAKEFAYLVITKNVRDGLLPITYPVTRTRSQIICNTAYLLTPYSMKKYQGCSSNSEVIFNNLLRSARNQSE